MFWEKVDGYFENHKNPINTLIRQRPESLMLKQAVQKVTTALKC
jgi:hypothetical protein